MEIVYRGIGEIRPYENNPRKNDGAVDAVAASIREFGWKVPVVIDKDGVIVAGHTRYKAAQKLGIDKIPCIVADDLTEEQVRAYRLADNKVGELAEWDFDALSDELAQLDFSGIDMSDFGFEGMEQDDGGGDVSVPSFKYQEQYAVTVIVANESEQREVYDRLTAEGYECKVVVV